MYSRYNDIQWSEELVKKAKRIIEYQFDLEILYKRQELDFIFNELDRGKRIIAELKQLVYYDHLVQLEEEGISHSTATTTDSKHTLSNIGLINRLFSPSNQASRKLEHRYQYEVKKDGTFVKLVCPVCGKDKFGNILGLTNHCRILHDLRFLTPEERMERCGVPVSVDEIPQDYFIENEKILHSEMSLAQIRSQPIADYFNPMDNRFYIRKKIIIGNMTQRIPKGEVAPDGNVYTHKWKLFVCGPPEDLDIETFVKRVRFYLHSSYHPEDIVDVTKPPFAITRLAWGESPIRVQLHFWDKRNPPKDLIYDLSFKKSSYKEFTKSLETEHWIELDKSTTFRSRSAHDTLITIPTSIIPSEYQSEIIHTIPILSNPKEIIDTLSTYMDRITIDGKLSFDVNKVNSILSRLFPYFPLIKTPDKQLAKVHYRFSESLQEFSNWKTHRRMSVEWHRAYMMKRAVCQLLKLDSLSILPTKYVLLWCREHNTSNSDSNIEEKENNQSSQISYCRFCGRSIQQVVYASHLKRCPLKPTRNDPESILQEQDSIIQGMGSI